MIGRFIAGVGALVWSPDDEKCLLLRRAPSKDFAAGMWECVTGRLDQGEGFEDAVKREIWEELGVAAQVDFIIGTTHFYRGPALPENELVGVVYACSLGDPATIQISGEHSEYRWVTAAEAFQLLKSDDPTTLWIRRVIERAEAIRAHLPPPLSQIYRRNGFELG